MFTTRSTAQRQRSASRSTDDCSTKEKPRKVLKRYVHDPNKSSQSLASLHHDDLPILSELPQPSYPPSTQSTPMASPSTGYSSLFPTSLSSTTSDSIPYTESKSRSELGVLAPGSYSPIPGSASSRSSNSVSPWSHSPVDSDTQLSGPRISHKYPSSSLSHRPSTAPQSPSGLAAATSADTSQTDRHTRSHSRLTVSIKNLLSRPPIPSPSRLSVSSAIESESSSSSFHVPSVSGKWPITSPKLRLPDPKIPGIHEPATSSPTRASNALMDAHRRYASEATAKFYGPRTGGVPASQESLAVPSVRNASLPSARGREPRMRNVLRRRTSGSAKLSKGCERGIGSPSRPHEGDLDHLRLPPKESISRSDVAFSLTPAGAVVEAYKLQELHSDDASAPPKPSIDDYMSSNASHDFGYDEQQPQHSPAPYYTVFGASSGRRVRAGGPDDRWNKFEVDQRSWTTSQAVPSHQPSMSDQVGRSVTRKVSSRWRKFKGGIALEESPSCDKGHSKGRASMQELRGSDKSSVRATGRSMDGMPSGANSAWANPIAVHSRSGSEKGIGSEGGKLWRLMRRISTGGLRDRFQCDNKVVPPVPVIPKELLEKVNQGERDNEPLLKSCQQPPSSLHDKGRTRRPSTAPKELPVARPSLVASSPNSSDVASIQFFHRNHSARSSVSSYGEALDLSLKPEIVLDRHIITPLEQLRLGDDHQRNELRPTVPRSSRRSTSVPAGPRGKEDTENSNRAPLPSSCRRPVDPPSSGSSGPSSTSASASASPNTPYHTHGLGRSPIVDGIVSLSPPPRPARCSKRGEGSVASSSSHSVVIKPGEGRRQMDRAASTRSDTTARLGSSESGSSRGQDRDASKRFTFRELNAPRRPPLSEREKADIWDDLLARSDKAGGTLHINGTAELMSDNMRMSTYSEI